MLPPYLSACRCPVQEEWSPDSKQQQQQHGQQQQHEQQQAAQHPQQQQAACQQQRRGGVSDPATAAASGARGSVGGAPDQARAEWFDPKQKTGAIRVANQWLKRTTDNVDQVLKSAVEAVQEARDSKVLSFDALQNELATLWSRVTMLHYVAGCSDRSAQPQAQVAAGSDRSAQPQAQVAAGSDRSAQPQAQVAAGSDRSAQPQAQGAASDGEAGSSSASHPQEQKLQQHVKSVAEQSVKVADLRGMAQLDASKVLTGPNVAKLLRDPPSKGYQKLRSLPQFALDEAKLYDANSQQELDELQRAEQTSKSAVSDLLMMTRTVPAKLRYQCN